MIKLLSGNKEKWAKQFKSNYLRGKALNPNLSDGLRYKKQLDDLIKRMTSETEKEIKTLFKTDTAKEYFAMDASLSSRARILTNALTEKFNNLFASLSKPIAEKTIENANKSSGVALKSSIKELSGGLTISASSLSSEIIDVINASTTENVALIKSISQQYLNGVQQAVMRSITGTEGLNDLIPYLQNSKEVTYRRAKMIAYDQTRKAFNSLSIAKMNKIGVKKFEWLHSGGSTHPRKDHIAMSGNIYSLDNPPIIGTMYGEQVRGFPGDLPNCFVGSTKVSLANGCTNLWRYFHTGHVIDITVQGDNIISTTPNHPILTTRGWLPANEIQEGDYLISSQSNNGGAVNHKDTDIQTTFDDLFASLVKTKRPETALGSKFNFHGDIPKNNVDCISANNILPTRAETATCEQLEQFIFSNPNVITNGLIFSFLSKIFKPCRARGFRKICQLFFSHFGKSYFISNTSVSQKNTIIHEHSSDSLTRNIIFFRKHQNTISRNIRGSYIRRIGIHIGNIFHGRKKITTFAQSPSQMSGAAFMVDTELAKCHTLVKTFLCVEKKVSRIFSGHVYTLESVNGWYNITPAEIIVKNCRCRILPIISFDEE